MPKLSPVFLLATLLTVSFVEAAGYQKTDGTVVDPILDIWNSTHWYTGANLEPSASLAYADLSYADLREADLADAILTDAYLSNSKLHNADLTGADLTAANLFRVNLHAGDLTGANLTGAAVLEANLTNANLTNANLTDANLTGAEDDGANLADANLSEADLTRANLATTNLTRASLTGANLTDANLSEANLRTTILTGAILTGVNLSSAVLYRTDLTGADLTGADLANGSLGMANLSGTNLTSVTSLDTSYGSPFYYASTTLPDGFDPVAKGWTLAPACDFTPDTSCDLADINQMFQAGDLVTGVATTVATVKHDLIADGTLDAADVTEWLAQAAGENGLGSPYLRGDTNLDRDIDLSDYNILTANFNPSGGDNFYSWEDGNSDGDGDIDLSDYNRLAANFRPIGYATVAVPEPTAFCLSVAGVLLLAGFPSQRPCSTR